MDNHAGNLKKCNDNYLAGLIDSDFGVYIHKFMPRGRLQLRPTIQFVNVNFTIIEVLDRKLNDLGINHFIMFKKATVGRDKKELVIQRLTKCRAFADKFSKYCIVRRRQLEILSDFCNDRLYNVETMGWKQNNTPYTNTQLALFAKISETNKTYNKDYGFRNYTMSWLAGLVDGDGSFCFVVSDKRIIPTLDITTGSDTCLLNIIEIFDKNMIDYNIRTSKSKATKRVKTNKIHNIYVRSFKSLLKISELLENKLIIKSKQCTNIIKYIKLCDVCRFVTYEKSDIVCENKLLNHLRHLRD